MRNASHLLLYFLLLLDTCQAVTSVDPVMNFKQFLLFTLFISLLALWDCFHGEKFFIFIGIIVGGISFDYLVGNVGHNVDFVAKL